MLEKIDLILGAKRKSDSGESNCHDWTESKKSRAFSPGILIPIRKLSTSGFVASMREDSLALLHGPDLLWPPAETAARTAALTLVRIRADSSATARACLPKAN